MIERTVQSHARSHRILIYRPGQIGDTLIALPSLWALRRHFAGAHLCMLADRHPRNNFVLSAHVLPAGLLDDWLTYPANQEGVSPRVFPALWWEIRARRFDTLVYLAPRHRSPKQVWRDLAFFRLAGIKHFIAHRGFEPLPQSVNGGSLPKVEHETDHLLKRVALSGVATDPPGSRFLDLRLTEQERKAATDWLAKHIGMKSEGPPLLAFGPGSKWQSKVWPEERFLAVGQQAIARFGFYPVIFGGPEDYELGQRLIAKWGMGANAAGQLSVRQAAAAMEKCSLYVGNDTGTMHLAAAAGVKCVAIFAAVDWPGRWYPYGAGHVVLRHSVPCEGCLLQVCVEQGMKCLRQVEVKDVMSAIEIKVAESQSYYVAGAMPHSLRLRSSPENRHHTHNLPES